MTFWTDRIASQANSPTQPDTSQYTLAAPTTGSSKWDARIAQRANEPAQPDTSLFSLAERHREVDTNWTPPPGWVHTADGWNPSGTPEGVRTPMPVGYETHRRDGSSTNTPYVPGTPSLRGAAALPPVSTGGVASSPFQISPQQIGNILSNQIQQQNPMGNVKYEPRMQQPPMSRTMISPVGNYAPNGEVPANMQRVPGGGASSWNTAGQQAYLRQIAGNNPMQSRFNIPNGTQQAIGQGAQQNQQQQLMALLSLLFNRG